MVSFSTLIHQFAEQGEKTGWTYVEIPTDIALRLKPGNKKSFRVRGMLDSTPIDGMALTPMGEGRFIMALNAEVRKQIRKEAGAMLQLTLEEDVDYHVDIPDDLLECFDYEDPSAMEFFNGLPKSHRDYFIKWIETAKTDETRAKRIINTVNAAVNKWRYNEMIRNIRDQR